MNIYSKTENDVGNYTFYLRAYYATYPSIFADLSFDLSVKEDPCQYALITPSTVNELLSLPNTKEDEE